jgi:DNA-directed RNA polymerase specialized sigma24 family protein
MPDDGSITRHIKALKRGDRESAEAIWGHYFHRQVGLAGSRQRATDRQADVEEDVAFGALDSDFRRAAQGQFPRLVDRDELWNLLASVTLRKALALAGRGRTAKRGAGAVRLLGELDTAEVERVVGSEPTPELSAQIAEECQGWMDLLSDDSLRRVALSKLEGSTSAEIDAELGCVKATVEPKLQRIRALWARKFGA